MSRDFLIWFVAALLGMTATLAAGLVALDPYDTGRFSLVSKPGMPKEGPRLSNASRARDPGFDGAIIGNSHIQLVSPQRLRGLSGVRFVQLAIPGTGPTEQMQILAAFLRAHADPPKAIVIGIDKSWCVAERNPVPSHPFPGWLYSENDATYLSGLFRMASVRALAMRIAFLTGFKARSAADGYWDYEEGQVKPDAFAVQPPSRAMSEAKIDHFGPSDTLGDLLQATPASTRVVLVIAPNSCCEPAGRRQHGSHEPCRVHSDLSCGDRRTAPRRPARFPAGYPSHARKRKFLGCYPLCQAVGRDDRASDRSCLALIWVKPLATLRRRPPNGPPSHRRFTLVRFESHFTKSNKRGLVAKDNVAAGDRHPDEPLACEAVERARHRLDCQSEIVTNVGA